MDLKAGKATADSGAYVGLIKAAAGTTAEEKNGGVFVIPTNAVVAEDGNGVSVAVAESLGYTVETVDEVQVFTPSPAKADKTYFAIYDMTTLRAYRTAINNGTEILLAKVTEDFDMSEEEWLPIGTDSHPFHGTFDGQGHTISGLNVSNNTETDLWWSNGKGAYGKVYGFFGIANGGDVSIKNVSFTNVSINLNEDGANVGTILGYAKSGAYNFTCENVTVGSNSSEESSQVTGNYHVAGIIAKVYYTKDVKFENCINYADVTDSNHDNQGGNMGGVVAIISGAKNVVISNCHNKGSITGPTGNNVAGMIGMISANASGSILVEGCSNTGIVNNPTTTPGALATGVVNIAGPDSIIKDCSNTGNVTGGCNAVVGVVNCGTANVTLTGSISNSGIITQTNSNANGDSCGIIWVSNDKTLTVNNAAILNKGDVVSTKKAGGFQSSEQGVKFISVGTNSFENIGNISATCQNGFAYVGGVFGIMSGAVESKETMPFSINVHDCSITATGKGADVQYDDNNMSWSCAGGVVGQIGGKGFVFNNVVVQNVSINANGQNENTYNYAGGFVGMIRMNAQENRVNILTNATILTGNTINATHKGVIAGCSYDSQGGPGDIYNNALNYSGSFASGDALGQSWSEGTISLVE